MSKKIFFNVEVKEEKAQKIYKTIEKMNGVVDISEYLGGSDE